MLNLGNKLPQTVLVPDNEKKQVALAVCHEIDDILHLENAHYEWNTNETLDDLLGMDDLLIFMIDENISIKLGKKLYLEEANYDFEKLTVNQLIDVVYAKYNDLPLPNFEQPTLIQKFKRCFGLDTPKTRE